jgi:hypothetical protein
MMDNVNDALLSSSEKHLLCRRSDQTPFTSIQFILGLLQPIKWGVKFTNYPNTGKKNDQYISSFFDRVGDKMSYHSSNCLPPTTRISVAARQPQGLFLVLTTSQYITLLAEHIALLTHRGMPTINVYNPGLICRAHA